MSKNRLHKNDTYIDVYNTIFEVLQELNTRERHIYIIKDRTNPAQQAFVKKTHTTTQQEEQPITWSK
jgi:hypothetical protein